MNVSFELQKLISRWGVADSQLFMGHWTPEFYEKRVEQYRKEFAESLKSAK